MTKVDIVRCKDCKWYREGNLLAPNRFCYRLKDKNGENIAYNMSEMDYCSYGERKEDKWTTATSFCRQRRRPNNGMDKR